MHWTQKFGLTENESSRVAIAWSMRLLYQIGLVAVWTIVTSLFVQTFGIGNLGYLFLIDATLVLLGTVLAAQVWNRVSLSTFFLASASLTAVFAGGAMLFSPESWIFFAGILIAKDVFFSPINIALFRQNESFFSPSEAQKTIPIIDSAITIGIILGAGLTLEFLGVFGTKLALILWVLTLAIFIFIVLCIPKWLHFIPSFASQSFSALEPQKSPMIESLVALKKVRFLRHLALIIFLQSAFFIIVEYEFTKNVHHHIAEKKDIYAVNPDLMQASFFEIAATEFEKVKSGVQNFGEKAKMMASKSIANETLAHDLSVFHFFFGVIALFVQLLFTSKILQKIGIIGSLVSYLGLMFLTVFGMIFGVGSINILRGIQHGFHSVGDSAYHLSFYSFFSHRRESIRLFLEGMVKPFGVFLGVGVLFLVPANFIFYPALVLLLAAILVGFSTRGSFTSLSGQNLQLENHIQAKLHSIEVLGQKGHQKAVRILARELAQKNAHRVIREKIIFTAAKIKDPEIFHTFSQILTDKSETDEIKIKILESALRFGNLRPFWANHPFGMDRFVRALHEVFDTSSICHLKKLAIMNLFRSLPPEKLVGFFLENMEKSDDFTKSIFLRSCRVLDDPEITFYISKYLKSPCSRVRAHAVMALWKFESHAKLRKILANLLHSDLQEPKISAIYAIGEIRDAELFALIAPLLDSSDFQARGDSIQNLHLLIAAAKFGERKAIDPLIRILIGSDIALAQQAYKMLDRIPGSIQSEIESEIQSAVARKVFEILSPQKIKNLGQIQKLSKKSIQKLHVLYRLAKKYDDLLAMENMTRRILGEKHLRYFSKF